MGYRRRRLVGLGVATLLVCSAAAGAVATAGTARAEARHPFLAIDKGNFPDPDIIEVDGTFYAYSTNNIPAGKNTPVATAPTPMGPWTTRPVDALPVLGEWARQRVGLTWAPGVTRLDNGSFLLYYTARDVSSGRQCIGAAKSEDPLGPFVPVDDEPLICPAEQGGAIDGSAFVGADGQRYLLYKNDGNAIGMPTWLYVQPVADDGVTLQGHPIRTIRNGPEEGVLVENPYLVQRPNGEYVLFYSYGSWNDASYTEGYATAPSLTGPWTKADDPLLTTEGFDGEVTGPGGASVLERPGVDVVVFHGVLHEPQFHRGMYVAPLHWKTQPSGRQVPVVAGQGTTR